MPLPITYTTLGGSKTDYAPVIDSSTDRSATEVNNAFSTIAEISSTAPKFVCKLSCTSSAITLVSYSKFWYSGTTPTVAKPATGKYTLTLPATVTDNLGSTISTNVGYVIGSISKNSDAVIGEELFLEPMVTAANVVTFYLTRSNVAVNPAATVIVNLMLV